MSDWPTKTVEELVADEVLAKPMDGNHGSIHPKSSDYVTSGIPFVMASDLEHGGVNTKDCSFISLEQANGLRKGFSKTGDVLISHKATIGRVAILGAITTPFVMLTPQVTYYRVLDEEALDRRFLYYYFQSRPFLDVLEQWAGAGSTRAYLGITGQLKLPIATPPLPEQREIAGVLGALDDKIEANRKASACLEEMARALYRSWFVTFDPVHAKSQNRPPAHMPPETAALFPDCFGENGLPEGWAWETFESHYTVLETGKRPKGGIKEVEDGVPSIGAESIKQVGFFDFGKTKFIPRDYFEAMKKGRLSDGDILIYKDGGKPGELRPAATYISKGFPFDEACINEHVFRVRVDEDLGQHFGFLALSSDHCMHQMRELATGVAQPGLNQSAMKALSFLKPGEPMIIEAFNQMVGPLLDGCNEKAKENQTLATLRDTLLPRLMSGTLRVKAAEAEVEAVL
ncbi:restriction endonuclease subunit S [Roseobacter sp. A03A-229]